MEITQELNDLVFRLARRYIKDPLDEDCAQEVLYKLWKHADYATEGMIVMMLRYWYLKLKRDDFEDIDDHLHLASETEKDVSDLYMFVEHKLLTNREKMFFRLILEEGVSVTQARQLSNFRNHDQYNIFIKKCREIVDKRRRNNVLYH